MAFKKCSECGAAFEAARLTAQTCSVRCRQRRSERLKREDAAESSTVVELLRAEVGELRAHTGRLEARVQALENAGAVYGGARSEEDHSARAQATRAFVGGGRYTTEMGDDESERIAQAHRDLPYRDPEPENDAAHELTVEPDYQ